MKKEDLKERTLQFCVRIVHMVDKMTDEVTTDFITEQLLKSCISVGARYNAACRPSSARDFINRLKLVEDAAYESVFWLDLIEACNIFPPEKIKDLKQEANELLSIFVASISTARKNLRLKTKKEPEQQLHKVAEK